MPERGGVFVAVVGPSGAGKDTILALAKAQLAGDERFRFVRRVVTRQAQADAEDHDSLDEAAFAKAEAEGAFALTWNAHGLFYGLPARSLADRRNGCVVVANVSRRVLAEAAEAFGSLVVAEITADPALLAKRIAARGRESETAAAERLRRQVPLVLPPPDCEHVRIDNSGSPEAAASEFVARLTSLGDRVETAEIAAGGKPPAISRPPLQFVLASAAAIWSTL